ncbi:MAG: DMT family transporter [Candidatus Adiutrix sp.]|jgi:drug/metabolite transporter (DMT)-like permease|nr:DMT family transporter [Candidatus Adiutrix sp.]
MKVRTQSLICLVGAALLWSLSGLVVKLVDWNAPAIAAGRSLAAALTIAFLARRSLDLRPPSGPQWLGAVCMAGVAICFVTATKLTTAANAILIQYTAPVWVAVFAPWLLGERTSGRDWFFIALTFGGLALFVVDSLSLEGLAGIMAALGGSLSFAGLALVLRRIRDDDGGGMKCMVYGNLLLVLPGLFFWRPPWPGPFQLGLIVLAGAFQYGLASYLYSRASRGASSLEMVLITALEPILNPVWVFLVLGERPGFWALIGGVLVLAAVTCWGVLKTAKD